jgi:transcriptional regulator GlxA family with amidase domain
MATTKIVFLVLPRLHLLDLAGADQVFYEVQDHGVDIEVVYCSFTSDLQTSAHLPIAALRHFADISFTTGDYLIVPGAEVAYLLSEDFRRQQAVFSWLKKSHQEGASICSICTGAFVLALAGLLDGRKCTTHWKSTAKLQALFPKAAVIENILFTEDERILTSAGVTSGIDLALHIASRLKDDLLAFQIARELVVYMRRQGHHTQQSVFLQYRNHIHAGIHQVQDWLQDNIGQKSNLTALADIACMSPRNLTRIFRRETGISINDFVTLIRKEKIKALLKNPDITRSQIAAQCGLKSERQVLRLLQE